MQTQHILIIHPTCGAFSAHRPATSRRDTLDIRAGHLAALPIPLAEHRSRPAL